MNRCVIIGGAPISDYAAVKAYIKPDDFIVYCDCGLKHIEGLQAAADMVVGDFDSHENPNLPVETAVLPHMKDETDTFWAVKTLFERGYRDFLLLGVFGGRLDHTLANAYMLLWLFNRGAAAIAADDWSDFEIVGGTPVLIDSRYEYFSLLAIDGAAAGIRIENALYPAEGLSVESEFQIAVSNEPLPGKTARVSVKQGRLLLVRDRLLQHH